MNLIRELAQFAHAMKAFREGAKAASESMQEFSHEIDELEALLDDLVRSKHPPDLRDQMREAIARYHAEQVQEAEDA